jgi:hypothetical protein
VGLLDRLVGRGRRGRAPALTPDTPDLVVVAEAFDPAEADSAVLARSAGWRADRPAVLRHHLSLPPSAVPRAADLLAPDGWELRPVSEAGDRVLAHALRVQVLDALRCAQERSRMAGLAQRLGGDALGWDAMQPASPPAGQAG